MGRALKNYLKSLSLLVLTWVVAHPALAANTSGKQFALQGVLTGIPDGQYNMKVTVMGGSNNATLPVVTGQVAGGVFNLAMDGSSLLSTNALVSTGAPTLTITLAVDVQNNSFASGVQTFAGIPVSAVPVALVAHSALALDPTATVPASQVTGAFTAGVSLPAAQITGSLPATQISGNLPASQIQGSIASSALPPASASALGGVMVPGGGGLSLSAGSLGVNFGTTGGTVASGIDSRFPTLSGTSGQVWTNLGGGAGIWQAPGGGTPITARGDIYVGGPGGTPARLPASATDGYVLMSTSTATNGMVWVNPNSVGGGGGGNCNGNCAGAQTVVSGGMSGNSFNFITSTSSTVTMSASTAVVIAFGVSTSVNSAGVMSVTLSTNATWVFGSLAPNTMNYLCVDATAAACSTSISPTYSNTPPGSPVAGQYWYNTNANQMFKYSSGWVATPNPTAFIGFADVGPSTINGSGVIAGALNAGYVSHGLAAFYTPGSAYWVVPPGIYSATVEMWGGGGAGAGGYGSTSGGSGGGSGAYLKYFPNLIPGTPMKLSIGAGGTYTTPGTVSTCSAGNPGGPTAFDVAGTNVTVQGGTGASATCASGMGTGGALPSFASYLIRKAGNLGGPGGSSGGAGGEAPAGADPAVATTSCAPGTTGDYPGGGGGGAWCSASAKAGGAGGSGAIYITY